jgi:hypothetical protein
MISVFMARTVWSAPSVLPRLGHTCACASRQIRQVTCIERDGHAQEFKSL